MAELRKIPNNVHPRRHLPVGVVSHAIGFVYKMLPSVSITSGPENTPPHAMSGPLDEAVGFLQEAALRNNSDALYLLADMNFYGNYSHPRDLHTAYEHYRRLANIHGNSTAQFMLGVYHSTGIGHVVPRNSARALMNYMFAATRGDTRAEMAVGYRLNAAIASPKNCEMACTYYKRVADKAMEWYRSGPPGGMSWVREAWRIADDSGGAYGKGASVSSSGINAIKASVNSDTNAAVEDVIEYLDLLSQKGDEQSSLNLGRIYYEGQRGVDRDLELARKYFFMVAQRYWRKDGRIIDTNKRGSEKLAARAAGFIGRMYLRGDGVEQNFERAKMWFDLGKEYGDAQSQYGLGLMMLNGYGVPRNVALATQLFKAAADQDYAYAQVELGVLYLDQGGSEDLRVASNYFELAARYGLIEASYYLAEMIFHGVGRDRACGMALQYYKAVAEKAEPLVSSWASANQAFEHGDVEGAMLQYLVMAEQGYERAQHNVAHLLDPDKSRLQLSPRLTIDIPVLGHHKRRSPFLQNPAMALLYWTRSSRQGNVDSLVKMGDYYFYGIGTDPDLNKAVQCYQGASDYSQSAQALYNLGWMHENGVGLTQDYHLAKRFYDMALEINEEAYLPVTLSLLKLRVRSAWNTFTHGPIHSIQDEPSKS
jgi:SEL1 protein